MSAESVASLDQYFDEARDAFAGEIDVIFAKHAADGGLISGATLKRVVNAADQTTTDAIDQCLEFIGLLTWHLGRHRKRLLRNLGNALDAHWPKVLERLNSVLLRSA